jgi:ribosome-associated protein
MSDVDPKSDSETKASGELGAPDPREKARWIVEAALERKAERPVALDMRSLTSYADAFIVLTGRSDRQVSSIAEAVVHALKEKGDPPIGVEGLADGNWVLIDCNEVVVHVFDAETREKYDLERLWSDAARLDLGIEGIEIEPPIERPEGSDFADPAA